MIEINYNSERNSCIISQNGSVEKWESIKQQILEVSITNRQSASKIELPWSAFISNLKQVQYVLNKYDIEVTIPKNVQHRINDAVKKRRKFSNLEEIDELSPEEVQEKLNDLGFQRELTDQQKNNVSKLIRLHAGATFSVPGAGKTTEAIAFYWLKKNDSHRLLVICPKNAFPAWEEEFQECLGEKSPSIARLRGGKSNISEKIQEDHDVFLMTYSQYIRVEPVISSFLHQNQAFVFLDESHRIKAGEKGKTGRLIQKISHLPVGKLIMSGTPMPNGSEDLVSQFEFLFPEQGYVDKNTVTEQIQDVYVRTTKDELGLKRPNIIYTEIPFTEPQQHLYNLVRSEEYRKFQGVSRGDKFILRAMKKCYIRLLQIVSNPALLLKADITIPSALANSVFYEESNKIDYAVYKARKLASQNEKVIIWTQFVDNVELLSSKLADIGADYIHGGVDSGSEEEDDTREAKIKSFHNDPNKYVLVANPAACGEGISLHKVCHHAIYLDRNYHAAHYLQSMDRIHRLGLSEDVETTIEILKTPESIDERVKSRLDQKIQAMFDVLNDKSLNDEPETVDVEETGFNLDDAKDLIEHLKQE